MRSISRVCDVSINTVTKLLEDAGEACAAFQFNAVRDVKARRVQCDEIWAFNYAKQRAVPTAKAAPVQAGDVWTWTAIDPQTKLVISWMVGDRGAATANFFMDDLASRLADRVQLTTDGHRVYLDAVSGAFGNEIDYAMLVKLYGESPGNPNSPERKYSPGECTGAKKHRITGNPDPGEVSTSHVERANLTMRMSMRRFTRLTNAFSKKIDNHIHALSLYFVWYNFCRIHKSLRETPAMAAGITTSLMSMEDVVALIDKAEAEKQPTKRGPYRKRVAVITARQELERIVSAFVSGGLDPDGFCRRYVEAFTVEVDRARLSEVEDAIFLALFNGIIVSGAVSGQPADVPIYRSESHVRDAAKTAWAHLAGPGNSTETLPLDAAD